MRRSKDESYSDSLRRLFPEENHHPLEVGGNYVRNITFCVTEECSMACLYCYEHSKSPNRMSFETGKKFIDMILEPDEKTDGYINSLECPGCILEFIGGEPFLEVELIDKLTDYFIMKCLELDHPWATRYRISITSNGLHYFEPAVQKYLDKNFGNVSLTITIDGNKELHDSCRIDKAGNPTYDRAIAAADHWAKRTGNELRRSKVTLSPYNIDMAGKALIDLAAHGYKVIHCNCVYEKGWEISHAKTLYNEMKKVADYLLDNNLYDEVEISMLDQPIGTNLRRNPKSWCGGNGLMMCVAPDGNIYPCLRYAPLSIGHDKKPLVIGNINDGFLKNPEEREIIKCMSCVTRDSQCKGKLCENCPIQDGCGDCAAYSWEVTGKIGERTTFHCDTHKARVLISSYYQNKKHILKGEKVRMPMNVPKEWALEIITEDEYMNLIELSNEVK